VGGEALLLAFLLEVVLELLAVGGRSIALGCDSDVSVCCLALADGTLGVCPTRLDVHVGVVVGGILAHFLIGNVVVQVRGGEGETDLLVAKGSGQDDFLVAGLVFDLVFCELIISQ